jgi:hypothetical protein
MENLIAELLDELSKGMAQFKDDHENGWIMVTFDEPDFSGGAMMWNVDDMPGSKDGAKMIVKPFKCFKQLQTVVRNLP